MISYHRCRCGRLQVRRADDILLSGNRTSALLRPVSTGHGTPTGPASGSAPGRRRARLAVTAAGLAAAVLVPIAILVVPAAALLGCVGLGLLVGGLAGVGIWLVTADPGRGVRVVPPVSAAVATACVAFAGLVAVLGPATVVVLPGLYAVAGLLWWLLRRQESP